MKGSRRSESRSLAGVATIATAIGAVAVGAFAIGALAIGRLVIRRIVVKGAKLKSLEIEELTVTRLRACAVTVSDSFNLPPRAERTSRGGKKQEPLAEEC